MGLTECVGGVHRGLVAPDLVTHFGDKVYRTASCLRDKLALGHSFSWQSLADQLSVLCCPVVSSPWQVVGVNHWVRLRGRQ
jgi:hypothetical protein